MKQHYTTPASGGWVFNRKDPPARCQTGVGYPSNLGRDQESHSKIKLHKAPGMNSIPAEVLPAGCHPGTTNWPTHTMLRERGSSTWPSAMLSLYPSTKTKGKIRLFQLQSITLLSIAGIILTCVVLDRLIPSVAEKNQPESQCGFRTNWGTAY